MWGWIVLGLAVLFIAALWYMGVLRMPSFGQTVSQIPRNKWLSELQTEHFAALNAKDATSAVSDLATS
jgi:hypothetical protein